MQQMVSEWKTKNGITYLLARPKTIDIDDDTWMEFFEIILKDYNKPEFFLTANILNIGEKVSAKGYRRLAQLLQGLKVKHFKLACITTDTNYHLLGEIFNTILEEHGIKFTVEFFPNVSWGEDWICSGN